MSRIFLVLSWCGCYEYTVSKSHIYLKSQIHVNLDFRGKAKKQT